MMSFSDFSDLNAAATPYSQAVPNDIPHNKYSVSRVDFGVFKHDTGIRGFLRFLRLRKYVPLFEENNVNFMELLGMDESNLLELGIVAKGPRTRLAKAIIRYHRVQSRRWTPVSTTDSIIGGPITAQIPQSGLFVRPTSWECRRSSCSSNDSGDTLFGGTYFSDDTEEEERSGTLHTPPIPNGTTFTFVDSTTSDNGHDNDDEDEVVYENSCLI
ncbi:hypothetical protein SARC_10976, partial [Sphaeroforma arctica JP610]